jgi:hypothetical protein
MKKYMAILLMLSWFSSTLFAKADMKYVDEYLKVSGTGQIIQELPKQISHGWSKIKNHKDIDIESSFNTRATIMYVRKRLSKEFSNGILKMVISYYKSPLGKKYKQYGLTSDKDAKERAQFFKSLEDKSPSYNRIKFMNAFVERVELTPIAVHFIGEQLGMINASLSLSNNSDEALKNVSNSIHDAMLENALFAYRKFSDKELKSVMDYYYTNAGRFEQLIISSIFKELISESFAQISELTQTKVASN